MEQIKSTILNNKEYKFTETAYKQLADFMKYIRLSYKDPGSYNDIEIQLSVLLDMELESLKKGIIYPETINEVIKVLKENRKIKYKEKFFSEKRFESKSKKETKQKRKKTLRRDSSGNILGGVCSGIARKLGIDPVFIRVFFLIAALFRGIFIPVYIILWIIIPSDREKTTFKKNIHYKI